MSAHVTVLTLSNGLRPSSYSWRITGGKHGRSILRPSSAYSDVGESYLDMWKKAVQRELKSQQFHKIAEHGNDQHMSGESKELLEQKTELFNQILDVPKEERDSVHRLQAIDRASAAIAAARAFLRDSPVKPLSYDPHGSSSGGRLNLIEVGREIAVPVSEKQGASGFGTPGPDFWSWSPPMDEGGQNENITILQPIEQLKTPPNSSYSFIEKEQLTDTFLLPFESLKLKNRHAPFLPPLQSDIEAEKAGTELLVDLVVDANQEKLEVIFSGHAAEAAEALSKSNFEATNGVKPDGSKWWGESGIDQREHGVVCKWTVSRGVNADGTVEWEDKYWEACNQFGYKELGSEKSGRDASGNAWREYWREFLCQDFDSGLTHFEKTADKWGKNGKGDEWQEIWREHYDASERTEKWAHKWCTIDPNTSLEPGHAHCWHERWGEQYDGKGGSIKYTDKWAERLEGNNWSKWGDKWDEHFDHIGHGVKQGESWWEGPQGDRWARTWGEQHNGTGWVHKYGKSSSDEHWDTHVQQDTWYERYPHYGFQDCLENCPQLQAVSIREA